MKMGGSREMRENGDISTSPTYTWDEVKKHGVIGDSWIVVQGKVYNVTNFVKKHPGGKRLIGSYAGQDATDVWVAQHKDREAIRKYMKPLYVGELADYRETDLEADFRQLRTHVEDNGLLRVSPMFYVYHLASILAMELAGYLVLSQLGTTWLPYMAAIMCYVASQAQMGWLQHDFGHLSVFKRSKWNHVMQHFVLGVLKGASCHWWNYRHHLHHSKPNIIRMDPDINFSFFFVTGDVLPKRVGAKKKGTLPYNYQHLYFFMFTPLLLLYFVYEIFFFLAKRRNYAEILIILSYYCRHAVFLVPILGWSGTLWFFLLERLIESHWFVWCTQMSHIPCEVDFDHGKEWVRLQTDASCNVQHSFFNDWFSGHLNYQIEHHLFPTMPRHNFHKVTPLVQSLCKKHNITYRNKFMWQAFGDILRSLESSGDMWYKSYYGGITGEN